MRRITALLLGVMMLMMVIPAVEATPAATPFNGSWTGHDPAPPYGDGSMVHLQIEGGTQVQVVFTDEFGTVCVNTGSSSTYFVSLLTGKVSGTTLNATFRVAACGTNVIRFLLGESYSFEYDDQGTSSLADDTLWDGSVLWTREN